ncbi:Uncharacterized protein FKW44_004273, partial [Caligus rogercresseyi]
RYFDPSQNAVLFFDVMLPMECFMTTGDTGEMNLVNQIFDLAKGLAELQLSEVTLALYSAYILLQEGIFTKEYAFYSNKNIHHRGNSEVESSRFSNPSARTYESTTSSPHERGCLSIDQAVKQATHS